MLTYLNQVHIDTGLSQNLEPDPESASLCPLEQSLS